MPPRKTIDQQLYELEQKRQQLDARIQKKRAIARKRERKRDTRRKIIAGALALEHMQHDEQFAATMETLLREKIPRPEDRELFDME